jgi:hypothetical protein
VLLLLELGNRAETLSKPHVTFPLEQISSEVLKSSPSYVMSRKIEEINSGLQHVEKMLQQKSKNIEEAQEIQKVTPSFDSLHVAFLIHCPPQSFRGEYL